MRFQVILQQFHRLMAAFIDDLIFPKLRQKSEENNTCLDPKSFLDQLAKNINRNAEICKRNSSQYQSKAFLNFSYDQKEYAIEVSTTTYCKNLSIYIRKISKASFQKIKSKHTEILIVKDLIKTHYENSNESTYLIQNGCIVMTIKVCFQGALSKKKYCLDYFSHLLLKNFHQYHRFLQSYIDTDKTAYNQFQILSQFQQELHKTQNICTIPANFDISEQRSQYKSAQQAIKRQKNMIRQGQLAIVIQKDLEKNNHCLFQIIKNPLTSLWSSMNFASSFDKMQRIGKKMILIPKIGQRKIEDFLFNVIKFEVKSRLQRPIGSGGSSYIYMLQGYLSYINSVDYSSYKKNDQKSQRVIAIKVLKPELQNKMKHKLNHQKQIVSKLKGSCSNYIPKYYRVQKESDLSNGLLMEFIHGQQIDKYIAVRRQTISLWTKIFILLNIVHGMRHLVNYRITHFDLKPINIIVTRYLLTKIIDYGQAYHKQVCSKQYCPGYTFPYVAPQIYARYDDNYQKRPQKYLQINQKQDVFAFGMIMYQVIFNDFALNIQRQKLKKIYYQGKIYERIYYSFEKVLSYGKDPIISTLLSIIIKCLHPRPQFRPRFDWIAVSLKLILNSHINH